MSEILSQEEIDALLSAVSSGDVGLEDQDKIVVDTGNMTKYDFRRPKLISKEQMRTLQMLHNTFAKNFASVLSLYLRTIVNVNLALVEQFTYGEFIMSLPNPTSLSIFSMRPLEGMAILEINPALVFVIVDRLTGGSGVIPKEIREFTEIEQAIVLSVITMALERLQETWKHMSEITCKLESRETNPQFAQIASMTENVLLITFNAEIGENTGMISICIPFAMISSVLNQLSAQQWISGKRQDEATPVFEDQLLTTAVTLKAVLGEANVTIGELVNILPGDILVLDKTIREECELRVEDKLKFNCKAGIVGKKRAMEIKSVYSE